MIRSSDKIHVGSKKYGKRFVKGITIESTVKFTKVAWA